jgi:sugar phosphate permease
LVGDYFSSRERASANSIWITALALGPALVAPLASWALQSVGWKHMFVLFSLPGILIAVVVWFVMPSSGKPVVLPNAVDLHDGGRLRMIKDPGSWLLFTGYLTFNICFWGFLGWMPGYLAIQRHLDIKALGVAASVPYLCGFAGILIMGWLGSHTFYRFRGQLVAVGYLCAAASLYIAYTSIDIVTCLIGLCSTAFFMYGGFGPYASLVLDLAPGKDRGTFVGFVNTGGQIGGMVAPVIIGYVVRATGSFNGGFDFMVCALAASAACYWALGYCIRISARHAVIA